MMQQLEKSLFFKFNILIVLSMIFFPSMVRGEIDKDDLGVFITKCFHPTAVYQSIEISEFSNPTSSTPTETTGKVRFKGGFTGNSYYMKFTIYARLNDGKRQLKVEPGVDSAIFPPNPKCQLRDWF